ncbi:MAG: signal peptidase I [Oligoflexia bacterium]|nr:MAG: signal peptidase I [Oligoflexia bacterium]
MSRDLRGTWPQALLTFFAPLVFIFGLRWAILEPYVIPSGSMIPTLLIHDHILANKLAYGLHIPFSSSWIFQWSHPRRGEVVVFRFPETPDVFYIKRILAISGDEISVQNGTVYINGQPNDIQSIKVSSAEEGFEYFQENGHLVRYQSKEDSQYQTVRVPEGHFFVIGDNRDQSYDSRFWGFVPEKNLVGRAARIWLSCDKMLPSASFICDPATIRWDRLLLDVK